MNLNKFTHISLLKNDAQLKQKRWQITTQKKSNHSNFKKINKNHVPKKQSSLVKKKVSCPNPRKSKEKKRGNVA